MWISVGVSSAKKKKKSVKCHRLATECTAILVGKALNISPQKNFLPATCS